MESLWDGSIDGWEEPGVKERSSLLVAPETPAPLVSDLEVVVVRSAKRRKSVSARIVGGRVEVRMPQWMTRVQEAEYVNELVAKLERQRASKELDLATRAAELAFRYGLPQPTSIRWVANQNQRWGSCSPGSGDIRITDRIAKFPHWVIDAVVVHELAHLVEPNHSKRFHALANRYPRQERAHGFLLAMQLHTDDVIDLR